MEQSSFRRPGSYRPSVRLPLPVPASCGDDKGIDADQGQVQDARFVPQVRPDEVHNDCRQMSHPPPLLQAKPKDPICFKAFEKQAILPDYRANRLTSLSLRLCSGYRHESADKHITNVTHQ